MRFEKKEDRNTRYYIDLDLMTHRIIHWDYDQRDTLVAHEFEEPFHHRVFISKGQYNKLVEKHLELGS